MSAPVVHKFNARLACIHGAGLVCGARRENDTKTTIYDRRVTCAMCRSVTRRRRLEAKAKVAHLIGGR
jgi:hypothetical protein